MMSERVLKPMRRHHNASREDHVLLYANGSPCQTPYRDYSRLLQSFPSKA